MEGPIRDIYAYQERTALYHKQSIAQTTEINRKVVKRDCIDTGQFFRISYHIYPQNCFVRKKIQKKYNFAKKILAIP